MQCYLIHIFVLPVPVPYCKHFFFIATCSRSLRWNFVWSVINTFRHRWHHGCYCRNVNIVSEIVYSIGASIPGLTIVAVVAIGRSHNLTLNCHMGILLTPVGWAHFLANLINACRHAWVVVLADQFQACWLCVYGPSRFATVRAQKTQASAFLHFLNQFRGWLVCVCLSNCNHMLLWYCYFLTFF